MAVNIMAMQIEPSTIFRSEGADVKTQKERDDSVGEQGKRENNPETPVKHTVAVKKPVLVNKKEGVALQTQTNLAETIYLARLRNTDAEVRAHEQAHLSAADGYARGGPHYIYIIGPDGRLYAVGGSIDVDLSPVHGNPEATIRKARIIRRAAFAPMDPSSADMQVAARAYALEMEAQRQLVREKSAEKAEDQQQAERQRAERQSIALYA
jgi:hypothetical protein